MQNSAQLFSAIAKCKCRKYQRKYTQKSKLNAEEFFRTIPFHGAKRGNIHEANMNLT